MLTVDDFRLVWPEGLRLAAGARIMDFAGHVYLSVTQDGTGASLLRLEAGGEWEVVYEASPASPDEATRERGCRGLAVFQGKSDSVPVLYAATDSPRGARILRSEDGAAFTESATDQTAQDGISSFEELLPFGSWLLAIPQGDDGLGNNWSRPALYVSDDPSAGPWRNATPVAFEIEGDEAVSSLCAFGPYLYAGTTNSERGFGLWRTKATGEPPFTWEQVLAAGAGRHTLNERVSAMAVFDSALYLAAGASPEAAEASCGGPLGAEIIRLEANNSWELIVGTPRFSPDGLKVPMSVMGPGFDNPDNTLVSALAAHDGCLYFAMAAPGMSLHRGTYRDSGGLCIWASQDGETFQEIAFGETGMAGACAARSTSLGLVVATECVGRELADEDPEDVECGGLWIGS